MRGRPGASNHCTLSLSHTNFDPPSFCPARPALLQVSSGVYSFCRPHARSWSGRPRGTAVQQQGREAGAVAGGPGQAAGGNSSVHQRQIQQRAGRGRGGAEEGSGQDGEAEEEAHARSRDEGEDEDLRMLLGAGARAASATGATPATTAAGEATEAPAPSGSSQWQRQLDTGLESKFGLEPGLDLGSDDAGADQPALVRVGGFEGLGLGRSQPRWKAGAEAGAGAATGTRTEGLEAVAAAAEVAAAAATAAVSSQGWLLATAGEGSGQVCLWDVRAGGEQVR